MTSPFVARRAGACARSRSGFARLGRPSASLPQRGWRRRGGIDHARRAERVARLHRVRSAAGAPRVYRRAWPRGGLHRRSLEGMGREAGGDDGIVLPGGEGPRREHEEQLERHGDGQRAVEDVQGRRRRHVSEEPGRKADRDRDRGVRRLRPEPARAEHRRLQGTRRRGQGRDLRGPRTAEHAVPYRLSPAAETPSSCITRCLDWSRPRPRCAAVGSRRDAGRPGAAGWRRTRRRRPDARRLPDRAAARQPDAAADHRVRRVLRLPLQRSGQNYADYQGEGRQAGAAAAGRAQGRHDHDQRRRRPTTSSRHASPATSSASSRAAIRS